MMQLAENRVALASSKARQWGRRNARWLPVLILLATTTWFLRPTVAAESDVAKPSPKIVSLRLLPDSLTLTDARDVQHVLVLGQTDSGQSVDLSTSAGFRPSSEVVSVSATGAVKPLKEGA